MPMKRQMEITDNMASSGAPTQHLEGRLFCRAKPEEATTIMYALTQYQEAYGQTINFDKSEMIFSPNISNDAKKEFYDKLPIKINDRIQKYLGLPTL